MAKIEIYTWASCPYCIEAKKILTKHGFEYVEYDVKENTKRKNEMIRRSKRYTVPQIFMDNKHIGGYEDLKNFINEGGLNKLKKP